MRRILLALGALIAALAAAAPAQAGRTQESIFQDDRVLLDPSQREAALDTLQSAGVDTIHSLVFWHKVAPAADSDRKPAGFNAASPAAYPAANWDPYDDLVRGAGARGMQVLFSPNGFTPEWASSCETARYRNCRPNAREFGRFVQAVGRRYSGRYRDENQGGGTLPKVSRWSIWNEPNQLGWIYPQVSRGRFVGVQIYRNLVNEGIRALRRTGHRRSKIYLGETAPLGDRRGRFPGPVRFYQELFCMDSSGRAYRGSAARSRGCSRFRRFDVQGVTHHPYNRGSGGPTLLRPPGRDDVVMSTLERLERVLAQGARRRAISRSASRNIYFTEYGIETNPPDTRFGVRPAQQAEFLNQAEYVAYKRPLVKGVAQYELIDEPCPCVFNTGLFFNDGAVKPGFAAYRVTIWVAKYPGNRLRVFGRVRPGSGARTVQIQNNAGGSYTTVKTVRTNSAGIFFTSVPNRAGKWKLVSGGLESREARPGRR